MRDEEAATEEAQSTIHNRQSTITSSFIPHPSSLVEIGSARPDELDTVLRAMCVAFELPYDVARPIYYSDPYIDPANKLVLRMDGEIISCLTLSLAQCRIGKAVIPIAGISGVATLPEHQRQGYASQLIAATVQTLRTHGHILAGLFPYDYAFYRRMGWETASVGCKYVIAPQYLPVFTESIETLSDSRQNLSSNAVHLTLPHHLAGMANVYEATASEQTLWAVRDAKRWQYLFDRVTHKYVYVDTAETVEGYLLYDIQPGIVQLSLAQEEQPPILRLLEFCAITKRAQRGLITHLSAQRQVGRIETVSALRHLESMGLLPLSCSPQINAPYAQVIFEPAVMLRIVDFKRLLEALRVNWEGFSGKILLTLREDIIQANAVSQATQSVLITGNGSGLPQVIAAPQESVAIVSETQSLTSGDSPVPQFHLDGDVRTWSQVVVGHISGEDACASGRLLATTPTAAQMVGILFPARSPFLPTPDHF